MAPVAQRRGGRYWAMTVAVFALVLIPLSWTGAVLGAILVGSTRYVDDLEPFIGAGMAVVALAALFPALVARHKGRDAVRWWLYGCALWPAAMVHAAVIGPTPDQRRPGPLTGHDPR